MPVAVGRDVEEAAEHIRPHVALYVGGMGSGRNNFHREAVARLGYESACAQIEHRWAEGDRAGAAAAVPTELILDIALAGRPDQIGGQLAAWRGTVATGLVLQVPPAAAPALIAALGPLTAG